MSDQPSSTDNKVKQQAYSKAQTRLRQENPDLWNKVLGEEYQKVGIDWKPKPTEEEKAQAEVERLLAAHPNLQPTLLNYLANKSATG